ncbi:DNA invertase Pin-like site-specific DNA recombinase [Arcanobacterium pluranimalium]|uniref:recombinase family protein n=1 Tax=Arcanobacterium pluranimalium TaxID=108028 RepID=UPI001EF7BBF5|nr:recombinase family protein [Arcanobacterium pluranimalium]MBM7824674.1 DNA invertase Pin-like site-specific DNA recombinase [Arcanobacterium pluranimalium]
MEEKNLRVIPAKPVRPAKRKVAAYARVSTEQERQLSSIAAQVSHYSRLIQTTPGWDYAGVFIDEGITGTSTKNRDGFNNLMTAAREGHIDLILTKSISRFARNTLDLLEAVRELKSLGVAVRFERENIDTATADGELLLTLLASFAQEESRSTSINVKWGIRKKYAHGGLHSRQPYGYRYHNGELHIVEHEAAVVKRVFDGYLAGVSPEAIATQLNAEGVQSRRGEKFHSGWLRAMLENETYTGSVILQKQYRATIADAYCQTNTGQLPRYLVTDSHPAIIDPGTTCSSAVCMVGLGSRGTA